MGTYTNKDINLFRIIKNIEPVDKSIMDECQAVWDYMGKPIGSLGQLEAIHIKLAGISGKINPSVDKRTLVVMCADNGIVEEGVTQTGQEVTAIVAENFFDKKTATAIMCEKNNCALRIIDIGMAVDTKRTEQYKVSYGTNNFTKKCAIERVNVIKAIENGIRIASELKDSGCELILTGEMGIGNTTTSSAVSALLLGKSVKEVSGKGAGLSEDGLTRKIETIENGINMHFKDGVGAIDADKVIDILSAVGGLDICGMVGLFIGGAYERIPVVIDGFISAVSALCAYKICNRVLDYMIPSHMSAERASVLIFDELGLKPIINAEMRLGEGSGGVTLLPFLDIAVEVFEKMGTFDDIGVVPYEKINW